MNSVVSIDLGKKIELPFIMMQLGHRKLLDSSSLLLLAHSNSMLIKMAPNYTHPIVVSNKMAVKLHPYCHRRADVISHQSERSGINSEGASVLLEL